MKDKFYYIDENGKEVKYVGKIVDNLDGTYSGLLTKVIKSETTKNLEYHPEVEEVKAAPAYYSYINEKGEDVLFLDNFRTDEEGNPYFTYVEKEMFKLDYYSEVPGQEEYFSYIDSEGVEQKYTGSLIKKGNKYYGLITK